MRSRRGAGPEQREDRQRIDARVADADRPVQMRARDAPGRADTPDDLVGRHRVAFVDVDRGEMRQQREDAQAVIDHHCVA